MTDAINGSDYYSKMAAQNNLARGGKATQNTSLDMQDFLKLLVAQLQNQDMMNPMKDSEFMSQMAQFSMVQAINDMSTQNLSNYALSMMGKTVTAAVMNSKGELEQTVGVVTGIGLFQGQPVIYIGDKQFSLSSIMVVGEMPKPPADTGGEGEGEGEGDKDPEATHPIV